MKLYYPITVDLYNPHPLPRMNAQQHNVGRGALITLTANGQVIVLDEETVRIFAKRPDKNTSYLDCSILEGKIQADFTDQMLASEGIVEVELELTTAETNITTPIFIVEVNKSNVKEGVQSSNEYKALEKYTAEAKEAAEQAQEVYDNIPNYEAILEANSILSKASGEVVTTTDSAKVKPRNIKLFGKGKQNIIPGNQLIPYPFDDTTFTSEGISCTDIGDGSIYVKGTSTDIVFFNLHLYTPIMLEAGEYSFIAEGHESGLVNVICYCPELDTFFANGSTFVLDTDREVKIWLDIAKDVTVDRTIRVMLNRGGIKPWEPYVGGEQSPNVRYPQKAEFLGESGSIGGKVLRKNFLPNNATSKTENGVSFTVNADKSITIKGTPSAETYLYLVPTTNTKTLQKGKYVISGGKDNVFITMYKPNWTRIVISENNEEADIELLEDTEYFCYVTVRANYTYDTTIYPMVRPYGMDNTYEVHSDTEQPFTFQTPNGLRGIPLGQTIPDAIKNSPIHMSGVYWDGEQYQIADTENEDGKDVQRIQRETVTLNRLNYPSTPKGYRYEGHFNGSSLMTSCLCNIALYNAGAGGSTSNNGIRLVPSISLAIIECESDEESITAIIDYILAEPIITDTTEEEKAQLDALVMNYPNTTIVNDAGAYVEVEYVCDTKEHIKQNYTPKSVTEDILERLGNVESQIALNS